MNISQSSPDFTFLVIDKYSSETPNIIKFRYSKDSRGITRLKALGSVWTPLEINQNINKLVSIWTGDTLSKIESPVGSNEGIYPSGVTTLDEYWPDSPVFFAPNYPDFLLPVEEQNYNITPSIKNAITWEVVRMEPGTVSGPPFRGTQEISPRRRETILVFDDSSRTYLEDFNSTRIERNNRLYLFSNLEGQFFDTLIQYNIWSRSNYEVELLTHWFMERMRENNTRSFLRQIGINNYHLWTRVRDQSTIQMKTGYHVRSVLYYFRTEEIILDTAGPIKSINLNVHVENLEKNINLTEIIK